MRVIEQQIHTGPNLFAPCSVVRFTVEPGPLGLSRLDGDALGAPFLDQLQTYLPGFQPNDGASFLLLLAQLTVQLQREAGELVEYAAVLEEPESGRSHVLAGYRTPTVALGAWGLAWLLAIHCLPSDRFPLATQPGFDFHTLFSVFLTQAENQGLGGLTTHALIDAAEQRRIPWFRLSPQGLFIQLGEGNRQSRSLSTLTEHSTTPASRLSLNKAATHDLLQKLGIPVPRYRIVTSPEHALQAAHELSYPLVLKPIFGGKGIGVQVDIRNESQLLRIFSESHLRHSRLMLETMVPGDDHRLLVVSGRLVATARRTPAHVIGDGTHTVAQLVEQLNRDPRRGGGSQKILVRVPLDAVLPDLAEQGITPDLIPPPGMVVRLRRTANIHTGATAEDVSEQVHPDNRALAERVTRIIGLDVAGIDLLTPDITRSWREVGGAVCEVNAAPGLRVHVTSGLTPSEVAGPILEMLFPTAAQARIPTAAITGSNGKTTTCRMLAAILRQHGLKVGLCCSDGTYIDDEEICEGDNAGGRWARRLLLDPGVEAGVFELARGMLARKGTYITSTSVAAVLNITSDHIGVKHTETAERLVASKTLVAKLARETLVLNADDPASLALRTQSRAERIVLVSMQAEHPEITSHLAGGGRAVTLEERDGAPHAVRREGDERLSLLDLATVPATFGGSARHNLQNALFAVALADALGVTAEPIRTALGRFAMNWEQTPGRLNFYPGLPFEVMLDYTHNPEGMTELCHFLELHPVRGTRSCLLFAYADRPQEQARLLGRIAAGHFDRFVCTTPWDPRGCDPLKSLQWVIEGLEEGGVSPERIVRIPERFPALDRILEDAVAGDLVVILSEREVRKQVWERIGAGADNPQVR